MTDAQAADDSDLVREQRGGILSLRLNRPDARNAMTHEMVAGIGTALVEAEADAATRVVVITGTGDRAFCAGMDLSSYADGTSAVRDRTARSGYMRFMAGEITVPVVGAANGTAVAGGFELLLGCDAVVAAEGARFGLAEVKRGLIPGGNGMLLAQHLPLAIAMEMGLTGDTIDANRAYQLGLVNAVVPVDDVLPTALALAERIAANAPLAVAAAHELTKLAASDTARAWARLEELRPVVFGSEDAKEGARAFLEKREPRWQGR